MKYTFFTLLFTLWLPIVGQSQHAYCSKYKHLSSGERLEIEDFRSDSTDIVHTVVNLNFLEMSVGQISGSTRISFVPLVPGVEAVNFDFEGLEVDSVSGAIAYDQGQQHLELVFSQPLDQGETYEVEVFYHGEPIMDASGWGGFYFQNGFAWNLGVGFASDPHSYGRVWFPCFDNFIERSTFEFKIITPGDKYAACNGELIDSVHNTNGSRTFHWLLNQPIPSYLACVAVGSYEVLESVYSGVETNIPVRLYARPTDTNNVLNAFQNLHATIEAFENAYGKYRFGKVGYSFVPFTAGAMEHATNITYPIYAVNNGLANEDLMAHELAHMWWGDNITCQTDGDMWLNEGWASFSEFLFQEHVYGRKAYENAVQVDLRYMLQYGHHFENGYRAVSGQPHDLVYGDHVYKKGALVAHNLRGYLGDEAFFDACSAFMEEYKYSPVSSDTLERFFTAYTGVDLTYFFRDWVFTGGYNVVVLDSFHVAEVEGGFELQMYLQQKLKGREIYHEEVPVYFTVFDENWNSWNSVVEMSGRYASLNTVSPIKPEWVVVNFHNELAQARTSDVVVISETGALSLKNMFWEVDVESVDDSAMVRFEQIWSYPDPFKYWQDQVYKLNDYRYWKVSGLGLEKVDMSGYFFYDGRVGGSNGGYLDINLLAEHEDSLVLLFRADASDNWQEYDHYAKNMLGINDNALGLIELDKIWPGEYVLANIDHRVLALNDEKQQYTVNLYPNPTDGELRLESDTELDGLLTIRNIYGKEVYRKFVSGTNLNLDLTGLTAGTYILNLSTRNGSLIFKEKFVFQSSN